jgi:hypothetical protein
MFLRIQGNKVAFQKYSYPPPFFLMDPGKNGVNEASNRNMCAVTHYFL